MTNKEMTNKEAKELIYKMILGLGDTPKEIETQSIIDIKDSLKLAYKALENAPLFMVKADGTIEPIIKTGKWGNIFEYREDQYHKCSNCHFSIKLTNFDNFCPNCGAKMEV